MGVFGLNIHLLLELKVLNRLLAGYPGGIPA